MDHRTLKEDGFLMIELIAAQLILTIALLAFIGALSLGFFAVGSAGQTSAAGQLANNQLELYSALPYSSIGLDGTTFASVQSTDATYSSDESTLPGSGTDVPVSGCGSSPQCSPVQMLTGADHKTYKLETFIRLLPNPSIPSRLEKVVTEVVRNASVSSSSVVLKMQTAFDTGPPSSAPPLVINCGSPGGKCESLLADPIVVSNTVLTIVAMDDGPIQTTGASAPVAYLSGVQQLGVAVSATSGWPQNYVDTYGGSMSDKYETLITITLPSGLAPGTYAILVTAHDSDGPPGGDPDQWSWPITVSAGGTVTG